MTIAVGSRLPEATLLRMGANGPESVTLSSLLAGRKVVIFGFPGAFTGTCTTAHVPSFIRTKAQFDAKGVDEIIGLAVNDPFVMARFGESTGATAAGIAMLADPASDLTTAIGMNFDVPAIGFHARSKRYAAYVVDGVVQHLSEPEKPGMCETSSGEAMLDVI
jgi:glutaredoxin/glutathione-dependent peroxiredoxin